MISKVKPATDRMDRLFLTWIFLVLGAGCVGFQPAFAEAIQLEGVSPPKWVSAILSAGESGMPGTIVTTRHPDHGSAREELQQLLASRIETWIRTRPQSEHLRSSRIDWHFVSGLISVDDIWIGQVDEVPTESAVTADGEGETAAINPEWIGVARVELNATLLKEAESLVVSRSIFARVETAMLGLAAVAGTIAIVWFKLLLDHKTRHHFSRRFQMLAVAMWFFMGIAVVIVWRLVLA